MAVSKTKKKFAFDVGWVFTGLVVALVIRFLRKIVLARYLGPTDLGLFSMCLTIGSIITLVAGFGLESAVIKYVAEYKEDKNKLSQLVSSAFLTMIIFGVLSGAILFILSDTLAGIFNMPSLSLLLKIFCIAFPFTLIFSIILGLFNGLREMNYHSYANISRASLAFTFILILILIGFGVRGAVLGYVLAEIAIACIFFAFIKKYFRFTTLDYKQNIRILTSFGSRILGENVANTVSYEADTLLIGYFLTATDVGYYAIAVALSRFFWLVPNAIQHVTYPATSEYWSTNNHSALQKMIDKSMKYTACILFPIGLGVGFFARDIITLIFGGEFIFAVLPLRILIIGTVILGIAKSIGGFLAGIGKPGLSLKINSTSAIINVTLNVLLIPLFGISGAALATMTSFIVLTILTIYLIVKIGQIQINIKPYIQLSVIAILVVVLFILNMINVYLLGIILSIYVITIFTFVLREEDRQMLRSLILR